MAIPDLAMVEGFEWDDGNALKSLVKHSVEQAEVEQTFLNFPLLVLDDVKHSESEPRFHAYGKSLAGRLLQVSFTLRASQGLIRVISARPMSRRERLRYAEEV